METPRLRTFLKSVEDGFSPTQWPAILAVFIFLVFLFVILYIANKKKRSAKLQMQVLNAEKKFKKLCYDLFLSPSQISLLRKMNSFKESDSQTIHKIILDHGYFSNRKEQPELQSQIDQKKITLLELKLGFPEKRLGSIISSTVQIPLQTIIKTKTFAFKLVRKTDDALILKQTKSTDSTDTIKLNQNLQFFFQRPEGFYSFETIFFKEDELFYLTPCLVLYRRQVRNFFRHPIHLNIKINKQSLKTLDVGGGGFSILKDDSLDIFFSSDIDYKCVLNLEKNRLIECMVKFLYSSDLKMHFEFLNLQEGDKDKILNRVLSQQRISLNS